MSTIVIDPYAMDFERLVCQDEPPPDQSERSLSRRDNCQLLTTFLVVMAAVSLAIGLGESLIPAVFLQACGLALDSIGVSVIGLAATALVGIGLAICLTWKSGAAGGRRHMFLAPIAAMAIGTIIAYLIQFVGHEDALTWLICPVYLIWAWGSAVCGR
jgi:hypothetical protein